MQARRAEGGRHGAHCRCTLLPGFARTLHHASPMHGTRAPGSPDKAPQGLPGKERFYFWLPRDFLPPNGGAGTPARAVAKHSDEGGRSSSHRRPYPSGLGSPGGAGAPTVPRSRVPRWCLHPRDRALASSPLSCLGFCFLSTSTGAPQASLGAQ